jgi:hypothetical protein
VRGVPKAAAAGRARGCVLEVVRAEAGLQEGWTMSHPVQQLLGLTDEQVEQLQQGMMATAVHAYWQAIEEAIGQAMIEARVWDGEDETATKARDFIRGQIGLEAVGDGSVKIRIFAQHAATVHPPKAVAIPRPAEETRLVQ